VPGTETGGQTAKPGGQTARGTKDGGQTASPSGQTAYGIGAGGMTGTAGGQTTWPCAATPLPTPRAAPTTVAAPHAVP
jgi:hypothetical protein